VIAAPQA